MLLYLAYVLNFFNLGFPEVLYSLSNKRIALRNKSSLLLITMSICLPFSWLFLLGFLLFVRYCEETINTITRIKIEISDTEIQEILIQT